jgi:hypothetical protein
MKLFLSKQDPRELPKGTRDPLGFEMIWTNYGRSLILNLTTITGSIEEFLTALLGFYLADKKDIDSKEFESRFLRFEQVAAYLRGFENKSSGQNPGGFIRGITRVQERLKMMEGDNTSLRISSNNAQILSNQSAYGLWGLYSTALDACGLIKSRKVQKDGISVIDHMLMSEELRKFLLRTVEKDDEQINESDLVKFSEAYVGLLHSSARNKLLEILLHNSDVTKKLFTALLQYFKKKNDFEDVSYVVNIMIDDAPEELKKKLESIRSIDNILTAMNWIFDGLRTPERKNNSLEEAIDTLTKELQLEQLRLPENVTENYLKDFVAYWNAGNLIAAANQVMSRHKYIMQKRNSAAWVEEENKKLKIRVEHHHKPVYPQKNFSYSYFIDSYIRLMRAYMKEANA